MNTPPKRYRIAERLHLTISRSDRGIECVWWPDVPTSMDRKTMRAYIAARQDYMRLVAAELGGPVVDVDCEGTVSLIRPGDSSGVTLQ